MSWDKEVFKWIKRSGAESLSLDTTYKHHREMALSIWTVHKHLFFMRKFCGHNTDLYREHMLKCQNALARIEFLCALHGNDTHAPHLSRMFIQMSNNNVVPDNLVAPRVNRVYKLRETPRGKGT